MECKIIVLCALVIFGVEGLYGLEDAPNVPQDAAEAAIIKEGEKKLSDYILTMLEHYKQPDPVGLPGVNIPDPMAIPDMKHSFTMVTMDFKNSRVAGLSKFRIMYVRAEIAAMQVNAALKIDNLQVVGDYTMSMWFSKSQGPFTVNLTDVNVKATANLAVERDGKLRAQDIVMDITFGNIAMNFENLGVMGSIFQGILNSVGSFLFDSIKPFILSEAYAKIRAEINTNLEEFAGDVQFPNSISPLDMVIGDARQKVRDMKLDPYRVKDLNSTAGMFGIELTNTWVMGISSFYRVGNITLTVKNRTLIADFEIGTQKLEGRTQWDINMQGAVSRAGTASFSIEYISARIILGQPLDTRQKPEFKDLQLELGNIQVRCDGAGTLDYIVELVVNVLPNLLRYQITDALETPIIEHLQSKLNDIDVEKLIVSKIPDLEKLEKKGLKLSDLKSTQPITKVLDEDPFWHF